MFGRKERQLHIAGDCAVPGRLQEKERHELLAFTLGLLVLTAGTTLAGPESGQVQQPVQEFKALSQVVAPITLTDEQR